MGKEYLDRLLMYQKKMDSYHTDNYLMIEEIKTVSYQITDLKNKIKELARKRDKVHLDSIGWMIKYDEVNSLKNKDLVIRKYRDLKIMEMKYNSQLIKLHDRWNELDDLMHHYKCMEVCKEFSNNKELRNYYNELFNDNDKVLLKFSINDYLEELFKLIPYSKDDVDISLKLDLEIDTRLYEKINNKKITNKKELIKAIKNVYNIQDNEEVPMVLKVHLGNNEVIALPWKVILNEKQSDGKSLLKHLDYDNGELVVKDLNNIIVNTSLDNLVFNNNQFRYGGVSSLAVVNSYLKENHKNKVLQKKSL